jgi:acyl CoA:acetate/3-ketoacid CoA transferase beta subunit
VKIHLQSENGIMGVGPYPTAEEANANNINAGKVSIIVRSKPSLFFQEGRISHLLNLSPSSAEAISISPC